MRSHLGLTPLYLRDALTDWDETLRVYRVHPKLVQRHIFNFRSGSQTGNGLPHPLKRIYFATKLDYKLKYDI